MSSDQRARQRQYYEAYKKRWAAVSLPLPTYQRIAEAAKALNITQAELIERACAGVGK